VHTGVHYGNPGCPIENTLLAFYIMLLLLSVFVFAFVLWDTGLLILFAFQRKKGFTLGLFGSTLLAFFFSFSYFFLLISFLLTYLLSFSFFLCFHDLVLFPCFCVIVRKNASGEDDDYIVFPGDDTGSGRVCFPVRWQHYSQYRIRCVTIAWYASCMAISLFIYLFIIYLFIYLFIYYH
jgi:hypothetical protein